MEKDYFVQTSTSSPRSDSLEGITSQAAVLPQELESLLKDAEQYVRGLHKKQTAPLDYFPATMETVMSLPWLSLENYSTKEARRIAEILAMSLHIAHTSQLEWISGVARNEEIKTALQLTSESIARERKALSREISLLQTELARMEARTALALASEKSIVKSIIRRRIPQALTLIKMSLASPKKQLQLLRNLITLNSSGLFDPIFYVLQFKDATMPVLPLKIHFLLHGAQEGKSCHPLFDVKFYLARNSDVAKTGANPLIHFLNHGAAEDRDPNEYFSIKKYREQVGDAILRNRNPLTHYMQLGSRAMIELSSRFDNGFYLQKYSDVALSGMPPLLHYLKFGRAEGRAPRR